MKIALIGYGNIANALVNGMISSEKILLTDDLYIFHNNSIYLIITDISCIIVTTKNIYVPAKPYFS